MDQKSKLWPAPYSMISNVIDAHRNFFIYIYSETKCSGGEYYLIPVEIMYFALLSGALLNGSC